MVAYEMAEYSILYNEDDEDMPITDGLPTAHRPDEEPLQTVTAGFMCTVCEPTKGLVDIWTTLQHIAKWAKLKGDITCIPSMAGSLVRLLTGDDEDPSQLEISEVASVSPQMCEKLFQKTEVLS